MATRHLAATSVHHRITRGETLTAIAANYNVSLGKLTKANNLKPGHKILVGQNLVIPKNSEIRVSLLLESAETNSRGLSVHGIAFRPAIVAGRARIGIQNDLNTEGFWSPAHGWAGEGPHMDGHAMRNRDQQLEVAAHELAASRSRGICARSQNLK